MTRLQAVQILKAPDNELVSIEDADSINLHTIKASAVMGITFPLSVTITTPH